MRAAVLIFVLSFFVPGAAASEDWRGLFGRVGVAFGQGDLTISHAYRDYSVDVLSVPTDGELRHAAVGYRWPFLGRTYLVAKAEVYDGDLTGSRSFSYDDSTVVTDFATTLTATLGGQLAFELGKRGKWLGAIGAGVAASKVSAHVSGLSPDFSDTWGEDKGATIGSYVELEVTRRLGRQAALYGNLKQIFYQGDAGCEIYGHDCGRTQADTQPLVFGIGLEWRF